VVVYNDLDEGAFSLPIIHALSCSSKGTRAQLLSILQSRQENNGMSKDVKKLFVQKLEEAGSLEYTRNIAQDLSAEAKQKLSVYEEVTGVKNWIFRLILCHLTL